MNKLEIERKFLIARPSLSTIEDCLIDTSDITQTYLMSTCKEERRVRKIETNHSSEKYFYTVKRTVSSISREENEIEISSKMYQKFLEEADAKLKPIKKTRYRFNYEGLMYEMDFYEFSKEYAILEIEIPTKDTKVTIPRFFDLIKEVTTDARYKNRNLAKTQTLSKK